MYRCANREYDDPMMFASSGPGPARVSHLPAPTRLVNAATAWCRFFGQVTRWVTMQ
jgi:hypothetical protein